MNGIPTPIDYAKVAHSIAAYQRQGFTYIEVPWVIGEEAYVSTSSTHTKTHSYLGYHVASAEQSFLELMLRNELAPGKYVACSPCFRDDPPSEWYNTGFLKVELIDVVEPLCQTEQQERTLEMVASAQSVLGAYTPLTRVSTPEGIDLYVDDIEVGSYGYRTHNTHCWIYGTGLAEPRFSHVLAQKPQGYHVTDIPKSAFGTVQKVYEEVQEFIDADAQQNPIMSLVELSDVIGAIEGYLERKFHGSITLQDALKMKEATRRAFRNGRRG